MAGLIVIGVVVAYVALFWVIVAKAKHWAARVAAVAVALLIPFWDLPVSYLKFSQLCSEQSGIRLDKSLSPTDTILIGDNSGYGPDRTMRLGFKTVEYLSSGKVLRFTRTDGAPAKSIHDLPASTLKFQFSGNKSLPWNLSQSEFVVMRILDGHVVARQVDFGWRGMWWESKTGLNVTSGRRCSGVADQELLKFVVASK